MSIWPRHIGLDTKIALLAAGSVVLTAITLVTLGEWQTRQYNQLAQREVDSLIDADLDHITQGIYNLVDTEDKAVRLQCDTSLNIARRVLAGAGSPDLSEDTVTWNAVNQFGGKPFTIRLPKMLVGRRWLGQNADPAVETPVVDEVVRLAGESATIFQRMNERGDMLRVATTVRDAEGIRAIGTYIPAVDPDGTPNPVITAVLSGETYHGRAFVVQAWHLTAYEPVKNEAGDLIGMLYVGVKQASVEPRVRHAILQTQVGRTGYVYVLSGKGEDRGRYIISQGGERDGESIWDETDSDGHHMVQAIIRKAMVLKPGELATVRYRWQNPDDPAPRWKIARLAYYAPWDWVIGTSVNEDELQTYQAYLTGGRTRMTSTMGLAGIAITVLIGLVGTLVTRTFTHPIQRMTKAVETIIQGNLDQTLDVRSHDELGTLARAFNVMTGRLSSTMEGLRRSEEKYRYIFENSIEGVFQTSLEGRVVSASPAMARILGYDSCDALIAGVTDLGRQVYVHPEERDTIVSDVLKADCVVEREIELYRQDGQTIWVTLSLRAVRDDAGSVLFLQGFVVDITERKRAEEEFRKVNRLQSVILDNSTVGIAFVRNHVFEWVNPRMPELFGITMEQAQGAPTRTVFPDDESHQKLEAVAHPFFTQGQKVTFELELRKGDGTLFWCRLEGKALDPAHFEDGVIWIAEDMTDRKRAEEALAKRIVALTQPLDASESISFDDLFDVRSIQRIQDDFAAATGVASIITRPDGTPVTAPSMFCRLCNDLIRQSDKGRLNCRRSDANLGRHCIAGPIVQQCLSGGLWDAGAGIDVGGHRIANWLIGQVRDDTQTEETMRACAREIGVDETLFLEAFHEVPSMSRDQFDKIARLLFTIANQLSTMAYQNIQQSRFIAGRQRAEAELRRHRDHLEELVHERTAELRAKNDQLVEEISEREQAERQNALMELQLRQAQKLKSIGQLAAGIAHEINTPIQYVGDNLRFLKEAFSGLDRLSAMCQKVVEAAATDAVTLELLEEARATICNADLDYLAEEVPKAVDQGLEGVNRVAMIVGAMKEFSHPGEKEKAFVDLNHAIETTVTVARNEWKYVAEAVLDLDPALPPVPCLPGELNQVILNLIINAAHAIADVVGDGSRNKGTITVTTRRQADSVEIRIRDTGAGIPETVRERIFDPFFTTKPVGQGTGQGLTIAHSVVVDKHGGSIDFETELGEGTTFLIRLPTSA